MAVTAGSVTELMTKIAEALYTLPAYDWAGFYLIMTKPSGDRLLVRGANAGTIQTFAEIQLGQGICGAVATSGESILLADVASDPRYISRDDSPCSEIVVPVKVRGAVIGILDVNSNSEDAFGEVDLELCENAANLVGQFLADRQA